MKAYPPSFFANLGSPCCSRWGKSELEWIAHAYVQALANDGDTWKKLTREQTLALLTKEQRAAGGVHFLLTNDHYQHWFDSVGNQITDEEGAFGVGGGWSKWRVKALQSKDGAA